MIPNFPFLGFPHYSRISQNYYYGNHNLNFGNCQKSYSPKKVFNKYSNNNCPNSSETKNKQTNNDVCSNSFEEKCSDEYDKFINIFGFKLYFDDILILLILFFLYQEEINDSYLYIILVLLLVS